MPRTTMPLKETWCSDFSFIRTRGRKPMPAKPNHNALRESKPNHNALRESKPNHNALRESKPNHNALRESKPGGRRHVKQGTRARPLSAHCGKKVSSHRRIC